MLRSIQFPLDESPVDGGEMLARLVVEVHAMHDEEHRARAAALLEDVGNFAACPGSCPRRAPAHELRSTCPRRSSDASRRESLRAWRVTVDAREVIGHTLEIGVLRVDEVRLGLAAGRREADEGIASDVELDLVEDVAP